MKLYHSYFNVPYEFLLGETDCMRYENMAVSAELGLSDTAIEVIKRNRVTKDTKDNIFGELLETGWLYTLFLVYVRKYVELRLKKLYDVYREGYGEFDKEAEKRLGAKNTSIESELNKNNDFDDFLNSDYMDICNTLADEQTIIKRSVQLAKIDILEQLDRILDALVKSSQQKQGKEQNNG